ncbi:hypothetical protein EHS13_07815 [Paenibacillus psychroresistens]|uniref:Muscle M-line assembly protein unc-89 Uncoordinated protein 89 n=1 Tax=Paenibacillus psychroresistens TaxID=1778678 RepID=A0A6B8RF29_9BACL|nr:hypothetical protein [Paenibacillus psychroresistens]QGQ94790.1 hypothetical protein EHS13_07815 [Paenibacillus psychroresistens]
MNISTSPKNEWIAGSSEIRAVTGSSHQTDQKQKMGKQDKITISPQAHNLFNQNSGKKTIMQRLMEQKQNIIDRRSDYISKGLEKGTSPEDMKYRLEQIDKQIEEIDKQVLELQHEELRKATGMSNEDQKEKGINKEIQSNHSTDSEQGAPVVTLNTMKALISTNYEVKQVNSVKMAQLTLNRESKDWAGSDPARSEKLKTKAEELNGKLINIVSSANKDLTHAIEKGKNDSSHHHASENEDLDITQPVNVNQVLIAQEKDPDVLPNVQE